MYPEELKYTQEHEWIRGEDGTCTIGITAYATEQLGDVTYVELPETGAKLAKGAEAGAVESVKAVSDIYAPVGGEVAEVNTALDDQPELVNESPYADGWFFKLKDVDPAELSSFMDAAAYAHYVEEQSQ